MPYVIKCRKCRALIIQDIENEVKVYNAHSLSLHERTDIPQTCQSLNEKNLVFLNEDCLPDWISKKIEELDWTRGRIHCPNCDSRIGAFDFISGTKCACNEKILPSVHVIRSKVDILRTTS